MNNYTAKFRADNKPLGKRKYNKRSSGDESQWKSPWSKTKTMTECLKAEKEKLFGKTYSKVEDALKTSECRAKKREAGVVESVKDAEKRKKRLEYQREWRKKNPESTRACNGEYMREWRKKNPEKVKQYLANYAERERVKKTLTEQT